MNLLQKIESLREQQIASIALMRDNYRALNNIEHRDFHLGPMKVRAIYNPARVISSAAKVDAASIAARPCFLCTQNRLEGQRSVPFLDGRYDILVNPYPIFDHHYVIAAHSHVRQKIGRRITDMWLLASELEGYIVFYNGPRCGASAPDHMHFQAVASTELSLWNALDATSPEPVGQTGNAVMSKANGLPISVFVIDSTTAEDAYKLANLLYPTFPIDSNEEWEPRFNMLATSTEQGVRIAVIPRPRHRPSFYTYDPTDEKGMTVSPASIDAAGVLVLPRRIDFNRLDEKTILSIYNETCVMPC